ncbi:MAG TPA: hypothetical protein VLU25_05635 [Acidobacteriota bacterium]|nr:hypothetical protein [Acidobacteriota bacterium]
MSDEITFEGTHGPFSASVQAASRSELVEFAKNQPPRGPVELGDFNLKLDAGEQSVSFKNGAGSVTFGATAGVFAQLGLYPDPARILSAIDLNANVSPALNLEAEANSYYAVIKAGFNAQAKANGSMALATGFSASFGAQADADGLFAVIQRFPDDTGGLTAVQKTADNWRLPRQVAKASDLAPGSWLITEVGGKVGVQLGATLGYKFNWIREAKLAGLTGDIGLRLQVGASVSLGFSASGRYAVVVSRETEAEEVRFRLFKQSQKGINFALSLAATVKAETPLPDRVDDLVKAIFGVQALQVIQDIEEWTNPDISTAQLLAEKIGDFAVEAVGEITGIDPETAFEQARQRLLDLFDKWNNLPGELSAKILQWVDSKVDLNPLRDVLKKIAGFDDAQLSQLIKDQISRIDFGSALVDEWLDRAAEAAGARLIGLLEKNGLREVRSLAQKTLAVLDGSVLEDLLTKAVQTINERLKLSVIQEKIDETSFKEIDSWLKAKLSDFLDRTFDFEDVEEVRKAINLVISKRQEFYEKALAAARRSYEFSLSATFQKTTSSTALIDVAFDFSGSKEQDAKVAEVLSRLVDGDLDLVLIKEVSGVKLSVGELTHSISKESHVEISLPFWSGSTSKFTESMGGLTVSDDGGRLLLYDLKAKNRVLSISKGRSVRDSQLMVGLKYPARPGQPGIRVFSRTEANYSYGFEQAARMPLDRLQSQLKSYAGNYFGDNLNPGGDDPMPLADWVKLVESAAGSKKAAVILSMQVTAGQELLDAWWKAPRDPNDQLYKKLSQHLQFSFRDLVLHYYFQDPDRYDNLTTAQVLLLYAASLPVAEPEHGWYWNWPDRGLRMQVLKNPGSQSRLKSKLKGACDDLKAAGKDGKVGFYEPTGGNISKIFQFAGDDEGNKVLKSLFLSESQLVKGAIKAAQEIGRFRQQATSKPQAAVKALTIFGKNITEAFNEDVSNIYVDGALRPMGSMLLVEAAQVLSGGGESDLKALLDLRLVKDSVSPFPPLNFPEDDPDLTEDDLLLHQRLVTE